MKSETSAELDATGLALVERLSGYWRGEGFGGLAEEWWSWRDGEELFGVFRGSDGGKTDLYEFLKFEIAASPPRRSGWSGRRPRRPSACA